MSAMHVPMIKTARSLATAVSGALLALGLSAGGAAAAGAVEVPNHAFSWEGMFGKFDRDQLRRGWQVYEEVCASCHGMDHLYYRHLAAPDGPAFSADDVKAIAAAQSILDLDNAGEEIERPGRPTDRIKNPYPNAKAAADAFGKAPPDLSLITKARSGCSGVVTQLLNGACGPEYVYALLTGYDEEPPEGFGKEGDYNRYYPGHIIAMSNPLSDEGVEYKEGTNPKNLPATVAQQAEDVTAFLTWAAEPNLVERKQAGLRNLLFLGVLAVLLWYSNRKLWAPVKGNKD